MRSNPRGLFDMYRTAYPDDLGEFDLATWSPGDGVTRYAIVRGDGGYFGGEQVASALGAQAAAAMVTAFVHGVLVGRQR